MYPVVTRVQAPDLGPPSCAPWIFPLIPPPRFGNMSRFGRPDLGPPSQAGRIFSSIPVVGTAQKTAALGHGLDTPTIPATAIWSDAGPAARPMYWFQFMVRLKTIDPVVWQPSTWTVDTPPPLGWLQRTSVSIPQSLPATAQARADAPLPSSFAPPMDGGLSVAWVKSVIPAATTQQLSSVWSQARALDPWAYPPWLPEPGPFDAFVAKVAIIPATVNQRAGIWSQLKAMDPGAAPNYFVDPSLWPGWLAVPNGLPLGVRRRGLRLLPLVGVGR